MAESFKERVLVVESNTIVRKIIKSELAELDVEILTAASGLEAISIAEKVKPNVIIMEVDLPELTGLEACNSLKNNAKTRDIPVVFVTQVASEEERQKAYEVGGIYYFPTPFEKRELADKVKGLLEKGESTKPQTVLVVEDSYTIRAIIVSILKKQNHNVIEAEDGLAAWEMLQKGDIKFDLILSDINMPRMNGFQLVRLIRGSSEWAFVPIVIASTLADKEDIAMLLNSGADDYIIKPFSTEEFLARIKAHIRVHQLYSELQSSNDQLTNFKASLEKMVTFRTAELLEANMASIMMLAVASEYRDTDTGNHVRRISDYSKAVALQMGYSQTKAEEISYSSILHDVGKIGVPDSILKKPGKLTVEEFEVMKSHTLHGESILASSPFFEMARLVARHHHEKFNGKGYPDGLSEYKIPLVARITSVVDVFDALTTERVYKKAWPMEKALNLIKEGSGEDFDPMVVDAFANMYDDGTVQAIKKLYA